MWGYSRDYGMVKIERQKMYCLALTAIAWNLNALFDCSCHLGRATGVCTLISCTFVLFINIYLFI